MTLDAVAAATKSGNLAAGAPEAVATAAASKARADSEALFRSWVNAFNTQLATRTAGNKAVVVADFAKNFDDEVANPAQYGLTNAKNTACPATGVGTDGLPSYNFTTCTDVALSAMTPPAGSTGGADWWKNYAFSDGFHPTPYAYGLMAQLMTKELVSAGWL
jgi:phospholipase/lecithinase/hemolysin